MLKSWDFLLQGVGIVYRTVYVNGKYMDERDATVSIFDRGLLMSDGVYDIVGVLDGKLIDFDGHIERLDKSLNAISISNPMSRDEYLDVHRQLVSKNVLVDGLIYLHVTRGVQRIRDFTYPLEGIRPTVFLFTDSKPGVANSPQALAGISVITVDDFRWRLRNIKTAQLLYASMVKMEAKARGADDAWMIEDGFVTEGSSNNAYIIVGDEIITRPRDRDILHGITRAAIINFAYMLDLSVVERSFTVDEAIAADAAFMSSATSFVTPVISINGQSIGDGKPSLKTLQLREIYLNESRKAAI